MNRFYFIMVMAGLWLGGALHSFSQYVPTHISNEGIYLFLDELATGKIIDLHSLVKPYSRQMISEKLGQADTSRPELTSRQQAELDFYERLWKGGSRTVSTIGSHQLALAEKPWQ